LLPFRSECCFSFFSLDSDDLTLNLREFAGLHCRVRFMHSFRSVFDEYRIDLQVSTVRSDA